MPRVLVVDDNVQIRKFMRDCLNTLGFSDIIEATTGLEALDLSQDQMPDIVTLDWNMPEMDGLKYLTALRQLPGGDKPVVIFCSTEGRTAKINLVMAAGANEYITKPFDIKILREKMTMLGLI